jgi:hypothetical protein
MMPSPAKEFEVGCVPEEIPRNEEAFQAMVAQNPELNKYPGNVGLKQKIQAGIPPGWEWLPLQQAGTGHRVTMEEINEELQRRHRGHPRDPE